MWDYPRPPRLERSTRHVRVSLGGTVFAETTAAIRILETSHPPTWYIPAIDVSLELLRKESKSSFCEWKGQASYWSVLLDGQVVEGAAWGYEKPQPKFDAIRDHLAFYPDRLECFVDGERVQAQKGGFYGGWITNNIAGPFKGGRNTQGW